MKLSVETLLERSKLKKSARGWKIFGIVMLVLFLLSISLPKNFTSSGRFQTSGTVASVTGKNYIARIKIDGIIMEDDYRGKILKNLAKNKNVKAIILHINSPGGSAVGGEILYKQLKELSAKKPIVVSMGTLATSAGYMIALAGERIYAHKSTITGSIGVIFQSPKFKVLAEKIGVDMHVIKSGDLKAAPTGLEDMEPKVEEYLKKLILDFYEVFVDIVVQNRKLSKEQVLTLADGRIYSGRQALSNKLIDSIGGEEQALEWLKSAKNISTEQIRDVSLKEPRNNFDKLFGMIGVKSLLPEEHSLSGLIAIWNP